MSRIVPAEMTSAGVCGGESVETTIEQGSGREFAQLHGGFLRAARLFPDHVALEVDKQIIHYRGLHAKAAALAATLLARSKVQSAAPVGVLAHRSIPAFSGVLGALMSGRAVVPLNPTWPVARTRSMIQSSGISAVVADAAGAIQLAQLLTATSEPLLILFAEGDKADTDNGRSPSHTFVAAADFEEAESWRPAPADENSLAYLFFTSGTTGEPKGVPILHRNAVHFVEATTRRLGATEHDRFGQFNEPTYDAALSDLFVAWRVGASVCCPPAYELLHPDRYIREKELTVIDMVPSQGLLMKRLGVLKPNRYPKLRRVRLGGERVPVALVTDWCAAAPNAVVENLYGTTETTVEVCSYTWDPKSSPTECDDDFVPIGWPLDGSELLIVDEQLRQVPPGCAGELLVAGPQVSPGYWRNSELTRERFVIPPGRSATFYRTGDFVRRRLSEGPLLYLERTDSQVKIFGVRVELAEVESVLRSVANADAVALGWPVTPAGAQGIVAFVEDPRADAAAVLARVRERLPNVMVPRQLRLLDRFPLTQHGKVDRRRLFSLLNEEVESSNGARTSDLWITTLRERAAVERCSAALADLVYTTAAAHFDWLFGSRDAAHAQLQSLVRQPASQFSGYGATVALQGGEAVGMLMAMTGEELLRRQRNDALIMLREVPAEQRAAFGERLRAIGQAEAAVGPDEYYLRAIAVASRHRRRGIAQCLLRKFAEDAAALSFRKLRLDVETANAGAIRLYEHVGFRSVGQNVLEYLCPAISVTSMLLKRGAAQQSYEPLAESEPLPTLSNKAA